MMVTGSLMTTPEQRKGRTASWPLTVLPLRHDGRIVGVWVRIGAYARWVVFA